MQNNLRFHLTPVGKTRIKRTTKSKCWKGWMGCGEKGTLLMGLGNGITYMSNCFVNQSGNYTCFLNNVIYNFFTVIIIIS